jgi:3-dehydroquinate synthase class II
LVEACQQENAATWQIETQSQAAMTMPVHETFHVRRDLSGRIRIECPPLMLVPVTTALEMARVLLQQCGAELIVTDPGQTVIRPGNGNGKILR